MLRSQAPSIQCTDVTLSYRRHPAVHHLSGVFAPGSFTALVGPNGAGKSTLLKGMVGLIKPDSGRIQIQGAGRNEIAYLPQQSALDRSFPMRVIDLAAMGLWRKTGPFRRIGKAELAEVEAAIAAVGLSGFEDRNVGTLSGGQFQRVLFARLLLQNARLILLDEPFTAIDDRTTEELLALICRWHQEGRTVIAVLHDFDVVRENIPETLLIAREPVAWGATSAVLTDANLARARRLQEAFDDDAELCERPAA
ncbi:zinc ABC transporter ATP-binding protein AztA [Kaistia dalseonensis]|uniref:Zinc/manganese transport system ATP-binding protein n=1 Tax=Kaistia dalseonensis TaxID=410840 RepID=A0ABU0H726_9HYPH|nr:zinc ABC transporter ATP-binding protein AztA [Kaistia dalseonensis]MCX5495246.1 zinc ABC transporter ATP-binding protein AztA [Kaistia dalseonensis]MDQ0437832.1 zinc/manganese transport system ATP-binding protein [Kaistia dalseonensis]